MTLEKLMTNLEDYFGEKYDGFFGIAVTKYLSGYSPKLYSIIFSVLTKRCSRSFNKSPGICEIESNLKEIYSLIPKEYSQLEKFEEISEEEKQRGQRILDMFFHKRIKE
jgi:hypothetical protein